MQDHKVAASNICEALLQRIGLLRGEILSHKTVWTEVQSFSYQKWKKKIVTLKCFCNVNTPVTKNWRMNHVFLQFLTKAVLLCLAGVKDCLNSCFRSNSDPPEDEDELKRGGPFSDPSWESKEAMCVVYFQSLQNNV